MIYTFIWVGLGFFYYMLNMNKENNLKRAVQTRPRIMVTNMTPIVANLLYALSMTIALVIWPWRFIVDTYEIWKKRDFYTGNKL